MFAATTQQTIALVVFLLAIAGWVAFLIGNTRKAKPEVGSEIELAPNRKPYLDDEELEGPHLERVLLWGVLSLMVIGVGLPLYWITEPNRQLGAVEYFDERLAGKTYHHGQPVGGGALFAATDEGGFNCAGCHGGEAAIGGTAPYTLTDPETGKLRQVQWKAPELQSITMRMSDAQIKEVLIYGRPFSPMPAWGIDGGGPMNEQQIDNLILYLHKLADDAELNAEKLQAASTDQAEKELERMGGLEDALAKEKAGLDAASGEDRDAIEERIAKLESEIALNQPKTLGAALFNVNCARCHTLGWAYDEARAPGSGAYGPPLHNTLNQFPDIEDHVDFVTNGRQRGEKYGVSGQGSGRMPFFLELLTEDQIKAIVEYERTLGEDNG